MGNEYQSVPATTGEMKLGRNIFYSRKHSVYDENYQLAVYYESWLIKEKNEIDLEDETNERYQTGGNRGDLSNFSKSLFAHKTLQNVR